MVGQLKKHVPLFKLSTKSLKVDLPHEILGFAFLIKGTDVASAQRFLLECGSDACSYSSHFVTLRLLPFEGSTVGRSFFFLIHVIVVRLTFICFKFCWPKHFLINI